MALDIFSVKPHEVSRDLKGYTIMMYGEAKSGKTTNAAKFPKALLLGFEKGWSAIPGVMALPVNKWNEFKQVIKQLKDDKAHEMYENIIIDTCDICYDLCEKYICGLEGVSSIGEIAYGGGYKKAEHEFDECLRAIPQMGYGLILISHAQDKTFKDENGDEYNQIVPTLANKPRNIATRMSDIIIYTHPIQDENGHTFTRGYMRGTPRFEAGSRFKYTPDYIDFSYENLVSAIGDAIDKQAAENNGEFVTDKQNNFYQDTELNYDELMAKFNDVVGTISANVDENTFNSKWAPKIVEIVERYLGRGAKITNATSSQVEQIELIVSDLVDEVSLGL